ncbi:MAG: Flagellar hook-associated 2 domain-containing protein [Thermotoga sp. 50_1627]|uniref:flagellar filament capping protein FliD n=1 Tax=Pseudothermotoga sp. TaxID=2033661 RepID=UPI00076CD480|nr:MAG: Flagellar hook-associated 2 domain-containing protein [Thermotoga sp. 50_64]KUK25327.1 MAG: Flagellar hook-associated 2 domain-containing protein [Thermotoga sp. 50_1627]MBC7117010.1 flagellar filament capping protein FliD [Pseudothermotoga sp.]MDK2923996.1 flagellar hook-associated protein 2 [Pseudothermotoga sp.]HBT39889.1 flagellar hook protein [Pseudothermotoga sp.]
MDAISKIAASINYRYRPSNIQFGGLASGLNTADIVDALMQIEARPAERLYQKYESLGLKQKAYQQLEEKLENFETFLTSFKLQATLMAKEVSIDSDKVSISASAAALVGSYQIKVLSIASKSSMISGRTIGPEVDLSTKFGDLVYRYSPTDSVLKIQVGATIHTVNISTEDTISDIVNKLDDIFGDGNVRFENGKLIIESDQAFALQTEEGTFSHVFNLKDAPIVQESGKYVLRSTAHVGAVSTYRTLSQISAYRGISITSGVLKINNVEISVDTGMTLSQLIDAINSSNAGVTAVYDENSDRLIVTSNQTGANTILFEDNGTNLLALLGMDVGQFSIGGVTHVQLSSDGVNWIDLYSSTTELSHMGLSIKVRDLIETPLSFSVENDVDSIVSKVKEFVDKWNELMEYIYNKYHEKPVTDKNPEELSEEEKLQGILQRDPLLNEIFFRLRGFITTRIEGEISYLWQLGIRTSSYGYQNMKMGKLELDEDQLRAVLREDPEKVWAFFGDTNGFAQQIESYVRELTRFGGRIDSIAGISGTITNQMRSLAKELQNWLERLQKREAYLWSKFSAMEQVVSRMQAQGSWLAQFTSLSRNNH